MAGRDHAGPDRGLQAIRSWRRDNRNRASPDVIDEGLGRRLRIDVELVLEQGQTRVRMGEREFAPTIAGEDPQCDALAILAKRVERDQPLGGRDRLFSISARVGVFGAFLEYVGGNVIELAPRPLDPTIERLFQRELRQEFTTIERRRALEIGGLRRVRKRSEFVRINAYALGPQADRICVDDKDVGVALEQVPA